MLIQFLLVALLALAAFITWRRAYQRVISVLEALAWTCIWGGALVVVLLPGVADALARTVGVGRGVDVIIYLSVPTLFLLVFKLFVQQEQLERKLTKLVRHDALRDLYE